MAAVNNPLRHCMKSCPLSVYVATDITNCFAKEN